MLGMEPFHHTMELATTARPQIGWLNFDTLIFRRWHPSLWLSLVSVLYVSIRKELTAYHALEAYLPRFCLFGRGSCPLL